MFSVVQVFVVETVKVFVQAVFTAEAGGDTPLLYG
jgi:hypothetical protein